MPRTKAKDDYCFYCKCVLSKSQKQMDHFPVPKEAGGTCTVPSCITCHDMKDRFSLSDWNPEWMARVMVDIEHNVGRETRIFMARVIKMHELHKAKRASGVSE